MLQLSAIDPHATVRHSKRSDSFSGGDRNSDWLLSRHLWSASEVPHIFFTAVIVRVRRRIASNRNYLDSLDVSHSPCFVEVSHEWLGQQGVGEAREREVGALEFRSVNVGIGKSRAHEVSAAKK